MSIKEAKAMWQRLEELDYDSAKYSLINFCIRSRWETLKIWWTLFRGFMHWLRKFTQKETQLPDRDLALILLCSLSKKYEHLSTTMTCLKAELKEIVSILRSRSTPSRRRSSNSSRWVRRVTWRVETLGKVSLHLPFRKPKGYRLRPMVLKRKEARELGRQA